MPNSWGHVDIFPVIARIIATSFDWTHDFVTHDDIVKALPTDTEVAPIIVSAKDQSAETPTAEWIMRNMVAWFSQRITVGESGWGQQFERGRR